jgi:ribulose 1,5-bisphosphate synthetase/thiazole synthase
LSRRPSETFARQAASFTIAVARMKPDFGGMRLTGKFSDALTVCTP